MLLNLSGWRGLKNLKAFSGFLLCIMLMIFHNSPYHTVTACQENWSCFKVKAGSVKCLTAPLRIYYTGKPAAGQEKMKYSLRCGRLWAIATSQEIFLLTTCLCLPIFPPPCDIFMPSTAPLPGNLYFYTIATISLLPNCTYCLTFMLRSNLIAQPF